MSVAVPADLGPIVAELIRSGLLDLLRDELNGRRRGRVPAHRLIRFAEQLERADADPNAFADERSPSQIDEWLDTMQAAERFGVTEQTIRAWCRSGRIPAQRVGREWRIDPTVKGIS